MSFLTSEPQKSRCGAWSWRYDTRAISEIRDETPGEGSIGLVGNDGLIGRVCSQGWVTTPVGVQALLRGLREVMKSNNASGGDVVEAYISSPASRPRTTGSKLMTGRAGGKRHDGFDPLSAFWNSSQRHDSVGRCGSPHFLGAPDSRGLRGGIVSVELDSL